MRCYLSSIATLVGMVFLCAQTTIVLEAGPISYTNIDRFVDNSYPLNIENCSSIVYEVDYNFSLPWIGLGNMDENTVCIAPDCLGDPALPDVPGCNDCWDFMWIKSVLDGSIVGADTIGIASNLNQSGKFVFGPICTQGATTASVDIRNQNNTPDETNSFSNVTIICWEATPAATSNAPICPEGNLNLDGQAVDNNDVSSWMWSNNGTGIIDNNNTPNTFATNVEDGETYTLTTTDTSSESCTASTEIMASTLASFTATVDGGGLLCPGDCTDVNTDVIIEITGGVAPYDVDLSILGIPFNIPGIDVDQVFTICYTTGGLPTIDNSTNPITISIPPVDFDIDVNQITDGSGCVESNIGSISMTAGTQPDVVNPGDQPQCIGANGTIDLTIFNDIISGGDNSLDVIYFETADLNDEVTDPAEWIVTNNNICAATFNGTCYSDFVCFGFDLAQQPAVDNIDNIIDCSDDLYVLPPAGSIADITPPVAFLGYFLDAAGTDGPVTTVPNTTTEVFIVTSADAPCVPAIGSVTLQLTPNPVIDTPTDILGGCGSIELPVPEGTDIVSYEYNTDADGNGSSFTGGDVITPAQNIPIIYLIANGNNGCTTILEISLDITSSIDYMVDIPALLCDSLVLPAITPATPTVAYYPMTGGMGVPILPGTILQAPYDQTLYLFDPNEDPTCAAEVPVMITISESPTTSLPTDTTACEFYVLDSIRGTVSSPDYTLLPISFPDSYLNIGDTIRKNTRVYILDTIGMCTLFDSLDISITAPPFVGIDTTITACEGYSSTELNLVEIIGIPDDDGEWSYPMVPDFNPVDPEQIDISTFPVGSYDFTYAIEDMVCGIRTATITLIIEERPYAGEATMIEVCNPNSLDFMSLISDPVTGDLPEPGGFWSQVPLDTIDIIDSTRVDLSTLPVGQYFFLYVIPANNLSLCEGDSASLAIDIQNGPEAGQDTTTIACLGSIVNIRELLSPDAEDGGMFFPDGFFLSGEEWNTTGSTPDQTYNVQYIIESTSMGCPPDTAFIEIFLADNPSAGVAVANPPPCAGSLVELDTYLQDESLGGTYVLTSDYTTVIDNPFTVDTTIEISYIIASVGGCAADTTDFIVDVIPGPMLDYTISGNNLCADSGDCIEIEINSSSMGALDFTLSGNEFGESYSFTENLTGTAPSTILICAQGDFISGTLDTIELNGNSSSFELLSNVYRDSQCGLISDTLVLETINLFPSYTEIIDTTICAGDSIEINGQFYSQSIDINTTTINGCDSLLQIMILNLPEASSEINGIFCVGTPIDVFGNQITRDTIATYIDVAGSSTGCDSIVNVDVQFQDVAIGILDNVICDGMPVMVGTEIFDENRTTDNVLLPNGSVAGCDSLVMVDLTYGSPSEETIAFDICSGDMPIDINGTLYGPNLLTGTEISTNASGCDSTITISLSLVPAIMELRDTSVCGTYSEIINGTTYDINNPSGVEMLSTASGCDSIVTIDLDFILNIEVTRDEQVCNDYTEDIGGTTYDINNQSGIEMLMTTTGCDSTIIIDFDFVQSIEVTRDDVVCSDYSEVIGNMTYDINNQTGTEMLVTSSGCDSTIIIAFSFIEAMTENRDDILCEDDSEVINGVTYDINNPAGIDTLRSAAGCDSIITIINFTFAPAVATIQVNDICADDIDGSIIITALEGLNLPVMITINGGPVETYDNIPIDLTVAAGTSDISIDDGNCMYQESISVMASTVPNSDIQRSIISSTENLLTLTSDITPMNINWSSDIAAATFSCLDCVDPSVISTESYTATVSYTDDNGCNYSESIFVDIAPIEVGELYIPNIFDLNLPGNNRFYIQTAMPPILIDDLQIYDRWGNKVFEISNFLSNDPDIGWDGTRDDKDIEQGVYVYMIKYNDGRRDNIRTGSITIIR